MSKGEKFKALFSSPLEVLWPETPRTSLSCISAGLDLMILKSQMDHKLFYLVAKGYGFTEKNVDAFMECSRRFGLDEIKLVLAVGSALNLVKMLYLEDHEIKALCRGETVRSLTLDTLRTMTAKEIAKALVKRNSQFELIADEEKLLLHFRELNPQARAHLIQSAELLSSANASVER